MSNEKPELPTQLPAEFADLQPFAAEWALPSEQARYLKLHAVTLDQLRTFYEAVFPRVDAIVAYLNQYQRGQLPAEALALYNLALTFTETSHPIDLRWRDVDFDDAYDWRAFGFVGPSATQTES